MSSERKDRPALSAKSTSLKDVQIPNWAAVLLVLVLIAICCGIFWISKGKSGDLLPVMASSGTNYASEISPNATSVEVLPQNIRSFNGGGENNPFATESLGEVRITGIVSNSNGLYTAIVESQSASYILSIGDQLFGSSWEVSKITKNSVTFSCNGSEKTVFMDGQN